MNRHRRLGCAVAAIAAAVLSLPASARADYRTFDVEGLRITVDTDWTKEAAPGYLPIRLDIANVNDSREIEIVSVSRRFFYRRVGSGAVVNVRRAVRLARGGRVAFTMPVPVGSDNESVQLDVREEGRILERLGGWNVQSGRSGSTASAILIAQPGSAFAKASETWPRAILARGSTGAAFPAPAAGTRSLPVRDYVLDAGRAPADWLGWTSASAVFVGSQEWEQLNEGQRKALRTWVAAGGDLALVDTSLAAMFPREPAPDVRPSGEVADYFFGRIHLLTASSITTRGFDSVLTAIETGAPDVALALPVTRNIDWDRREGRGFRLLIPGVEGVPMRAYLTILLLFSVLIGPVNYAFLRRRGLQVLFVLTAPIVATAFILLLAGYVIVGEGFSVQGRAVTFTRLDQARQQAATRATASLYAAGMTPSGGLNFPADVAVVLTGPDGGVSREELRIDWTDSQRFTSGAIRARSAANVETVGFRTARERLEFTRQGDQMSVVNGMGQTVTRLVVRDGGRFYKLTSPLPAGSRATMAAGKVPAGSLLSGDSTAVSRFGPIVAAQRDDSYLAVLERSPFWQPGTTVEEHGSVHLVLGTGLHQP